MDTANFFSFRNEIGRVYGETLPPSNKPLSGGGFKFSEDRKKRRTTEMPRTRGNLAPPTANQLVVNTPTMQPPRLGDKLLSRPSIPPRPRVAPTALPPTPQISKAQQQVQPMMRQLQAKPFRPQLGSALRPKAQTVTSIPLMGRGSSPEQIRAFLKARKGVTTGSKKMVGKGFKGLIRRFI